MFYNEKYMGKKTTKLACNIKLHSTWQQEANKNQQMVITSYKRCFWLLSAGSLKYHKKTIKYIHSTYIIKALKSMLSLCSEDCALHVMAGRTEHAKASFD